MNNFLKLRHKFEEQPCSVNSINDEYSILIISRQDFKIEYYKPVYTFSYLEKRECQSDNFAYGEAYEWLLSYTFNQVDLEKAQIKITNSSNIQIFFESPISLIVVNKKSGYKHSAILLNELNIPLSYIEDTLDIFNLLKKIKKSNF